jgi:hypothetical protein
MGPRTRHANSAAEATFDFAARRVAVAMLPTMGRGRTTCRITRTGAPAACQQASILFINCTRAVRLIICIVITKLSILETHCAGQIYESVKRSPPRWLICRHKTLIRKRLHLA